MALRWNGDAIKRRLQSAAQEGVNATMSLCVIHAKQHHNGWVNRTGTAEGSINIYQFARQEGDRVIGKWGSADVHYFLFLELRFYTLRSAADAQYPRLSQLIQRAFRQA